RDKINGKLTKCVEALQRLCAGYNFSEVICKAAEYYHQIDHGSDRQNGKYPDHRYGAPSRVSFGNWFLIMAADETGKLIGGPGLVKCERQRHEQEADINARHFNLIWVKKDVKETNEQCKQIELDWREEI